MGDISLRGHGIERRGPHGHGFKPQLSTYNKGGRVGPKTAGRALMNLGGRANLLEEVGRIDAERMNPNRRAEKRRVIGELNRGYNKGGRVKAKDGKWIQKATKGMRKDKPCTGKKFGGATCPPGSKRYNLAKTFKKMAKKRG
jgi:hypothetical protein